MRTCRTAIKPWHLSAAIGWLLTLPLPIFAEPATLEAVTKRLNALEQLVATAQTERAPVTWEDFGCVASDPQVDNGPMLSRILTEQGRTINSAPAGGPRDYYVSTPIIWPKRYGAALVGSGGYGVSTNHRGIGVTRLIWNGPPGQPMLIYRALGGRISQCTFKGGFAANQCAGCGILVENDKGPATGMLVTEQVTLETLDIGIKCADYPRKLWANNLTHYSLQFHKVRLPYWVTTRQSVCHTFYDLRIRNGYEQGLRFDEGGPLNVYGCYIGQCDGATLLYIGRSDSNGGAYDIQGLYVDGNAKNLRLVDHGKYAHRVRISGAFSKTATAAEPLVLERDGASPFAEVRIDCTNGIQWPVTR
jgi:hypothetical protein